MRLLHYSGENDGMEPRLLRFGILESPVVVVDRFTGKLDHLRALAASLSPFPPARNYYPGLRRILREEDEAMEEVVKLLERAAPFIGGGFDTDGFDLLEASFSMVTTAPSALSQAQRAPHFDSADRRYLALLLYLAEMPRSGTAFYRQRSTGIERVSDANLAAFVSAAKRESGELEGYIQGSNGSFEETGRVEAAPDRLAVYQGSLLHSGIIPADLPLSADPLVGRLTLNIFVTAH